MASRKRRKIPKSGSKGSSELDRLRARIRRHGNLITGLTEFKTKGSLDDIKRLLPELLEVRAYRQIIWPNERPTEPRQLVKSGLPKFSSLSREVEWSAQSLLVQAPIIRRFILGRRRCERLYLLGRTEELLCELDLLEAEIGVSLWLVETRINAIQLQRGLAAQKEYTSAIFADEAAHPLVRYLITWLSIRSEDNISAQEFDRLVHEQIPSSLQAGSFIHALLGTSRSLDATAAAYTLAQSDQLSPVDRYRVLVSVLQRLIASESNGNNEIISTPASRLSEAVDDPELRHLLAALGQLAGTEKALSIAGVLDAYNCGDYRLAVTLAESMILDDACVDALLIAVRAEALCNRRYSVPGLNPDAPLAHICADIAEVTFVGERTAEAEARLAKLKVSNASSAWSATIDLFLQRQRRDERIHEATVEQHFSALRVTVENPFLAYALPPALQHAYLDNAFPPTARGGSWASVDQMLDPAASLPPKGGSEAREIRMSAIWHLRRGDAAQAERLLSKPLPRESTPVDWHEVRLLYVEALILCGELTLACGVSAELILISPFFARRLPLKRLVQCLADWDAEADRKSRVIGRVQVVSLLEMYSRHVDSDREELKSDAFIDLLAHAGVSRPSDLDFKACDGSIDLTLYFLRQVCVPELLDQCFSLKSTREVEDERVKIIVRCVDVYASLEITPPAELQDELQQIRTRQIIRDTNLKLDQSKIFVDVEGIQSALGDTMRENWNRYRILGMQQDSPLDEIAKSIEDVLGRKVTVVSSSFPLSERHRLFERMFGEIRDQFASSKLFGLDANLSTNVRHGYILRELRGPFVAAYLVTNLVSDESEYQPNRHWLDRLIGYSDAKLDLFSQSLDGLSAKVDAEIERLTRKKIKIRSEANPDGLFDFSSNSLGLQVFQRKLDGVDAYEDFLRLVFERLWRQTQEGLDRVQLCLQTETQSILNTALGELQNEADALLLPTSASQVTQAINLARPEVTAAIERVASWFTLSTSREYQDYPLSIAFDVGLATVAAYFSDINFHAEFECADDIIMAGWSLPSMPKLYMLLFENAAIHSGISDGDLEIRAGARLKDDMLEVSITNQLGDDFDMEVLREVIERLNREFGSEAAEQFIQIEKKSGYPKLWKILRHDLHRDHAIEVSLRDRRFCVDILMNREGLVR